MRSVKDGSKKRKKQMIVTGLAVGVAGIVGYFTWQYLKSKKEVKGSTDDAFFKSITKSIEKPVSLPSSVSKPKATSTVPVRFASQVMLIEFPLKKGSRGERVRKLQEALITKHGAGILPKYGADGDFGTETESALKKLGIPTAITESIFNVIVAGDKTQTDSFGRDLFTAAAKKDFAKTLATLKKMKSTEEYSTANEYFKAHRINGGVRQTIVNGLLNVFSKPDQKEKIKFEFLRMGLQYDGNKWSLAGLDGLPLITKEPTTIWINATKGVNVPARMVLGNEVSKRTDYTLFENQGRYFLVKSNAVTYLS